MTRLCIAVLDNAWDDILGDPWLRAHNVSLNYGDPPDAVVQKGRRKIALRQGSADGVDEAAAGVSHAAADSGTKIPVLSAVQMCRMIDEGVHKLAYISVAAVTQLRDGAAGADDPLADVRTSVEAEVAGFSDVLVDELPAGLPPDRGIGHTIQLEPGARAPFRPMYRLSRDELKAAEVSVKDLLLKGLIEPSTSPYGAPILFVTKKDGSLRMCIDYRALNKLTVKNRYPLPRIDDLFDKLQGAVIFSALDLASGYHQILITQQEDVQKTAFRTPLGHFGFKVLCFGLPNAPATFQAVMNRVLDPYIGKFALVCMDEVLIYSKVAADHAEHVRLVLHKLREHRLYAKRAKCQACEVRILQV